MASLNTLLHVLHVATWLAGPYNHSARDQPRRSEIRNHRPARIKSSAVKPMSLAIRRSSIGEMSPLCTGTVVPLPSAWRNCLCEPHWRTSANPNLSKIEITSRGLRTGRCPISGNRHGLRSDVLRVQRRFTVFQEHFNHLLEIAV